MGVFLCVRCKQMSMKSPADGTGVMRLKLYVTISYTCCACAKNKRREQKDGSSLVHTGFLLLGIKTVTRVFVARF